MTPLVRFVSTTIAAVAFLIAMTHLLQAESGPGDGFTAGIISALALTLVYETRKVQHFPAWLENPRFDRILLAGLALVMVGALVPLLVGENLLAPVGLAVELPLLGSIELTQAKFFEIGLALAVFGGSMLAISNLRSESTGQDKSAAEAEKVTAKEAEKTEVAERAEKEA